MYDCQEIGKELTSVPFNHTNILHMGGIQVSRPIRTIRLVPYLLDESYFKPLTEEERVVQEIKEKRRIKQERWENLKENLIMDGLIFLAAFFEALGAALQNM